MRWLFVGVVILNIIYFGWALASGNEGRGGASVPAGNSEPFPAQLQLLGATSVAEHDEVSSEGLPDVAGCPALGPLSDEGVAGEIVGRLGASGIESKVWLAEKEAVPIYWVYLPPFDGRQQALRKLRELHAAGIDSFIVAEGPDANSISLGSFGARDSALGLQARLRASGYPAQVREQLKAASQYWVVIADMSAQGFMEFVPRSLHSTVRLDRRPCP